MRHVRIAVVTAGIAVALTSMWLAFAWHPPPASAPAARIHLIGYTNFTMSNPDTNVFFYPGRGSWLLAQMVLTNQGRVSISYGAWGDEPYGWAKVETDRGTTNGYLAPRFTGGVAILRPGGAAKFWVILPTNALRWQCGFPIEAASVRERAIWKVLENKFYRRVPEPLFYPLRLLPDKAGSSVEVKSGVLEISGAAGSAHNEAPPPNRHPRLPLGGLGEFEYPTWAPSGTPASVGEARRSML